MESDYARHSSIFQIISLSAGARDTSTAKVGYVIASSGQSLTDTTLLRPSLSICGRRFYHPPRRPFPSLSLSLSTMLLSRILARRKIKLSCERFSATSLPPAPYQPFPHVHPSFAVPVAPSVTCRAPFTPSRENGGANEASCTSARHLRETMVWSKSAHVSLLVKAISVFDFDGLLVFMLGVEWCL